MYHKNHRKTRRLRWRKEFVLLCAIATLLLGFVGTTVAYLFTATDPVENTFTPATVSNEVKEDFDGTEKKNITVTNTGEVPAYIRATYTVCWKDDTGNVYPATPSVTVTPGSSDWIQKDNIYYYTKVVAPETETSAFIALIKANEAAPEGYHLVVDVLAESIQANPTNAVEDSWKVTLTNGVITAVNG